MSRPHKYRLINGWALDCPRTSGAFVNRDTDRGRGMAVATAFRPAGDAIELLPFPALLVGADGIVRAASAEWLRAYPAAGVGTRLAQWWAEHHLTGAETAVEVEAVWTHGEGAISKEYAAGDEWRRLVIAAYPGGALVTEHGLGKAEIDPRARKMEAIGRLVGGVAHDFANLLTLIQGYSEMLLGRIGTKDPARPEMEEIRAAADRGARLTEQLLGFLRGETAQPRPVDLNAIVRDMQEMLRPIIGELVEMEADLDPCLERVTADPGQMEQVLLNLILNARDAMPQGGRIGIETCNCEMSETVAAAHGVRAGRYAMLSISDTGHGISAEAMERIFEPFFTTKKKDKGTGLGLSTVHGIVKHGGGDIWAASRPGCGAVFTLCLPALKGRPPATNLEAAWGASARVPEPGSVWETVLLVEDEEGVRGVLAKALRWQGYQVLEAGDGVEALRVFEERGSDIHLVLTDMVMPRMNGRELSQRLWNLQPDLKVIHMSGYLDPDSLGSIGETPEDASAGPGITGGAMVFLQKPVRPGFLAAKVREALDSPVRPFNPS